MLSAAVGLPRRGQLQQDSPLVRVRMKLYGPLCPLYLQPADNPWHGNAGGGFCVMFLAIAAGRKNRTTPLKRTTTTVMRSTSVPVTCKVALMQPRHAPAQQKLVWPYSEASAPSRSSCAQFCPLPLCALSRVLPGHSRPPQDPELVLLPPAEKYRCELPHGVGATVRLCGICEQSQQAVLYPCHTANLMSFSSNVIRSKSHLFAATRENIMTFDQNDIRDLMSLRNPFDCILPANVLSRHRKTQWECPTKTDNSSVSSIEIFLRAYNNFQSFICSYETSRIEL